MFPHFSSFSLRWLNGPKRKRKNSQCSVKSMTGEYLLVLIGPFDPSLPFFDERPAPQRGFASDLHFICVKP